MVGVEELSDKRWQVDCWDGDGRHWVRRFILRSDATAYYLKMANVGYSAITKEVTI